jgi:hypothetical protein
VLCSVPSVSASVSPEKLLQFIRIIQNLVIGVYISLSFSLSSCSYAFLQSITADRWCRKRRGESDSSAKGRTRPENGPSLQPCSSWSTSTLAHNTREFVELLSLVLSLFLRFSHILQVYTRTAPGQADAESYERGGEEDRSGFLRLRASGHSVVLRRSRSRSRTISPLRLLSHEFTVYR